MAPTLMRSPFSRQASFAAFGIGCAVAFSIGLLSTQQHGLGMHKLFAGQGLPSKEWNHAATRMDAGFSKATVALDFLALFAPLLCRGKLLTYGARYTFECMAFDGGTR